MNAPVVRAKRKRNYIPRIEALYDGQTLAAHNSGWYGGMSVQAWINEAPGVLSRGKGPFFLWYEPYPFPQILEEQFAGATPTYSKGTRNGYATEVETYEKELHGHPSGARLKMLAEIAYDPSIGYLPRYARLIYIGEQTKPTSVKECYLIGAQPCRAGGFVPTEWYGTNFDVDDFQSRYPDYNAETKLVPTDKVTLWHYKATDLRDRSGPVAFDRLDNARVISCLGGQVSFNPRSGRLTLDRVKRILADRLTNPEPIARPTLDTAELAEFAAPPSPWRSGSTYLGILTLTAAGLLIAWFLGRRRRAMGLLFVTIGLAGCGAAEPRINVTTALESSYLIYDPNQMAITQFGFRGF